MSWVDYYYQDNVNTTDALIVSIQLVLVGFVLHMVGGVYVAMLLAWTLLKLEDGASNMATRSQPAAGMDVVIRALRMDFAKDTEPTVVAILYKSRIKTEYVPISLFFDWRNQQSDKRVNQSVYYHQFHNQVRHSDYQFVHSNDQV
jgi:hypothetical protein